MGETERTGGDDRPSLLCLPYAGGAASVYRTWPTLLPEFAVHTVELPGHGRRISEQPPHRISDLVELLGGELVRADRHHPTVMYGHSMGGLLAYELTRWLRRTGRRQPGALVIGGRCAAHLDTERDPIAALPDDDFADAIVKMGGTPPEVMRQQALRELVLPILRADLTAVETYRWQPGPPLDVPIVAVGGVDDGTVSATQLAGWAAHTTAGFECHQVAGDHFFLRSAATEVARLIRAAVLSAAT